MPSDNNDDKNEKLAPTQADAVGSSRQFAMAMELPFILVAAVVLGGLVGYFLDGWLHTKPYLMLVFGFLGFFGGLRDVLRRVSKQP
jgi:F0F1-type ATP synthase assembly protein I